MTAFLIEKNTEVKKNLIIIVIVAIDILNNVKVTLWNDRQKLFISLIEIFYICSIDCFWREKKFM